jgi:hypothetical protein
MGYLVRVKIRCKRRVKFRRDSTPSDDNVAFGQEMFNSSMASVESEVEPDGIGNDMWRKSVALIGIHLPILANWGI